MFAIEYFNITMLVFAGLTSIITIIIPLPQKRVIKTSLRSDYFNSGHRRNINFQTMPAKWIIINVKRFDSPTYFEGFYLIGVVSPTYLFVIEYP